MSEVIGEIVTIIIMAFALGMDAFSISLGMGMYQMRLKQVMKIGLTVGVFHIMMPLFGIVAGRFLSQNFEAIAGWIGGGLLFVLGIQMIWSSFSKESESILAPVGMGLLLFALSVSLDSFSVGLTLGIYGAKIAIVLICFGVVSMLLSWLGLLIGRRVQGWIGRYSEVLGGAILVLFAMKLLFHF